jgi:hypothetical protein
MKPNLKLLLLSSLLLCGGCGTVIPQGHEHANASLSQTGLDSGVVAYNKATGVYYVNSTFVNRYNAMIDLGWGKHFTPAIGENEGLVKQPSDVTQVLNVTVDVWSCTKTTMLNKALIEYWLTQGKKP